MRSTYLDTELMLVIDSEKLSQQIHETESDYMEKSKEVLANGQETEGAKYQGKVLNRKKKLYYGVLRIITSSSAAALECVWKIIPKISCKL